jgi:hypothetical protein
MKETITKSNIEWGRMPLFLWGLVLVSSLLFTSVKFTNSENVAQRWFTKIAEAASSFNTDPLDFSTLRSSNYTKFPDSTTNWADVTSADAGDVVSLTIYYHNTSSEDAENVRTSISVPTSVGTSIVATGVLSADNSVVVNGQTTINISSSQSLSYIPGSTRWYPDQSQSVSVPFPFGQTGDEFVTSQGVNIGTIFPGWPTQGSVVARFQVSNDSAGNPTPSPNPTIDIKAQDSDGPVTLVATEDLILSWVTSNANECAFSTPFVSGVGDAGVSELHLTHPFYPQAGGTTYTINCSNSNGVSVSDSVTVYPGPPQNPPATSTIDITASGTQGPLSLNQGESFTIEWISSNASAPCTLDISGLSSTGVDTDGDISPIDPGHAYYPATGGSRTFTVTCAGVQGTTITDSVVVNGSVANPPQPPTKPVITVTTGTQCGGNILVSWNSVSGANTYKVFRDQMEVFSSSVTSFTDTGLVPGSTHVYTVIASNSAGDSIPSLPVTGVASSSCSTPPLPSPTLTASTSSTCGGGVTLSWNSVSGATSYALARGGVQIATTTLTTYSDTLLSPNTSYSYTVTALNVTSSSNPSVAAAATSSAQCPLQVTVSLTANPSTILAGATSTLSWVASTDATSCQALWTLSTSRIGSETVSPATTTVYSITCTNGVNSATDTETIIVQTSVPPTCELPIFVGALSFDVVVGNTFSFTLNATSSNTGTINYFVATNTVPSWLSVNGNSISGVPSAVAQHSIGISAVNSCGTTTATLAVNVTNPNGGGNNNPTVTLTANPGTVFVGATSTLTWNSQNTNACSASWTTATSTSGNTLVSPATTTAYSITCSNSTQSATSTATVVVLPLGQCTLPAIDSAKTITGQVNTALNYNLTATSTGTSTITFSIGSSTLPNGLTFSTTTISGTPTQSGTFSITVTLDNNCGTSTETISLVINPENTGGGGGGGGGSSGGGGGSVGGHRRTPPLGSSSNVLGAATSCEYLKDYLRIDWINDPVEVIKLQAFLKTLEGFSNLEITGTFDQATFDAVGIFQERYFDDILRPWGHDRYTGFVYILTKKKVNEIFCNKAFPLTPAQEDEVREFRAFIESLKAQGITIPGVSDSGSSVDGSSGTSGGTIIGVGTTSSTTGSIGNNESEGVLNGLLANVNLRNAAAAIFAGPQGWQDSLTAVILFLAILLALYIIAREVVDYQNKSHILTLESVRTRKVFIFILGLVIATIACLAFKYYEIILPLLATIIVASAYLLWFSFQDKEVRAVVTLNDPKI